jgi:hypothetical protein
MSARRGGAVAAVLCAVVAAGLPASAGAQARVGVMVVGQNGTLAAPKAVTASGATVTASGRRCAVRSSTPLAALLARDRARGPSVRVRDFGSCSRSARDGGGLFVFQVGRERNRSRDGWVYKVGHVAGTSGAADPSGPFGTGRFLRSRQRVTWYWCRLSGRQTCQHTLGVSFQRSVRRGEVVRVRVRAYDDAAQASNVRGATVSLAGRRARTNASGIATLRAPARAGRYNVLATRAGAVRSFTERIAVR